MSFKKVNESKSIDKSKDKGWNLMSEIYLSEQTESAFKCKRIEAPDERDVSDGQETNKERSADNPGVPRVVPVHQGAHLVQGQGEFSNEK